MKEYLKLDQLTALRFFVALMVVLHHSNGLFGINIQHFSWQGVSFFFILSGFMLTCVYPSLDTFPKIKRFWRARIARLWPAYIASFVLGFYLLSYVWHTPIALANLLMVHAWIPMSAYYFSYNSVCWSVSAEISCYLMFPILIYKWNQYWKIKFLLSIAVLLILLYTIHYFQLPKYGDPSVRSEGLLVTQHGLLYISPLSRIFQFIFGMVVATLWLKKNWSIKSTLATHYEIAAIVLYVLSIYYCRTIAGWCGKSPLGDTAMYWLKNCGLFLPAGLLIFVIAQGQGRISKILSSPFLIFLGQLSFSIFLLHQILLNFYQKNLLLFSHIPNPIAFLIFFTILMLSSYLLWACVEIPGRRFILGGEKIQNKLNTEYAKPIH